MRPTHLYLFASASIIQPGASSPEEFGEKIGMAIPAAHKPVFLPTGLDLKVGVGYGTFQFDVGIPPQITNYSPNTGPAGTLITISGTGFGETQGSSYALLQSLTNVYTSLTVLSWSDTLVTVSVPKLTPLCLNYLTITAGGLQTPGTFPFQVVSSNIAQAQIALQPNSIQTNVHQSLEGSTQLRTPPKLR